MIDPIPSHHPPSGAGARATGDDSFQRAGFGTRGEQVEEVWSGSAWAPQ
jgi:hypothetical protein